MVLLGWTLFAVVVGLAWFEYGRLSRDIVTSNNRVPKRVTNAVHPSGPTATSPQTILVTGIDPYKRLAGTAVIVRTDPSAHTMGLLAIPNTTQITPTATLMQLGDEDADASGLIDDLQRYGHGPINHVAEINLGDLSKIVQSLGGIKINNHQPIEYQTASGATGRFPAGILTLTGPQVAAYLLPHVRAERSGAARERREQVVMHGVLTAMLRSTTLSSLAHLGGIVKGSVGTDLTTDSIVGLASTRLESHTLIDCRLPRGASISSGVGRTVYSAFMAPGIQATSPACSTTPLHTPVPGVVATVVTTVIAHSSRAWLETLVVVTVAIWCLMLFAFLVTSPRLHLAAVAAGGGVVKAGRKLRRPRRASYTPAPHRDRHLPRPDFTLRGRTVSYAPKQRWISRLPSMPSLPFRKTPDSYTPTVPRDRRLPTMTFRNRPNPTYTPPAPRQLGKPSAATANALIMLAVPASIGIGIVVARVLS